MTNTYYIHVRWRSFCPREKQGTVCIELMNSELSPLAFALCVVTLELLSDVAIPKECSANFPGCSNQFVQTQATSLGSFALYTSARGPLCPPPGGHLFLGRGGKCWVSKFRVLFRFVKSTRSGSHGRIQTCSEGSVLRFSELESRDPVSVGKTSFFY